MPDPTPRALDLLVRRQNRLLDRFSSVTAVKRLRKFYGEAAADLEARIRKAARGDLLFEAAHYRVLLREVRMMLAKLGPQMGEALGPTGVQALGLGADAATETTKQFARVAVGVEPVFDIEVAAVTKGMIAGIEPSLLHRYRKLGKSSWAAPVVRKMEGLLAVGLSQGISNDAMGTRLMDQGFMAERYRADRIARTECLLGETFVSGAVVEAVHRRYYEGPVTEVVTARGRRFATTPNHPMLARRGWVAAGELCQSDYLVGYRGEQNAGTPGHQHITAAPTQIREVFDALSAVGVRERRRTAQPDFHGDGRDGEVDILRPSRPLAVGMFAALYKPLAQQVFSPTDKARTPFCSECGRLLSIQKQSCGCRVSNWYTTFAQALKNGIVADAKLLRELVRGFSIQVAMLDLGAVQVCPAVGAFSTPGKEQRPRDALGACDSSFVQYLHDPAGVVPSLRGDPAYTLAGEVELDRVVSVGLREFRGHVYNLSTPHGYFAINGLYTGNSAYAVNVGHLMAGESMRAQIPGLKKKIVAVMDDRTHPGCRQLHGTVLEWDEYFIDPDHPKAPPTLAPPIHPHSFLPWSMVETARGPVAVQDVRVGDMVWTPRGRWRRVTETWSAPYAGPAYRRNEVGLTSEHKVFAPGGWLRAEELRDECYAVLDPPSRYPQDAPAGLVQGLGLGGVLGALARAARVPVPAVDLDGRAHLGQGQIHVVDLDGHLRDDGVAGLLEEFERAGFCTVQPGELLARTRGQFAVGHSKAAARRVRGAGFGCESRSFLWRHVGEPLPVPLRDLGTLRRDLWFCEAHELGITLPSSFTVGGAPIRVGPRLGGTQAAALLHGADGNPHLVQVVLHRALVDAEAARDGERPEPLHEVKLPYRLVVDVVRTHVFLLPNRYPASSLVSMPLAGGWHEGPVFDLSVAEDEALVVGGMAASNCRCRIVPWSDEWEDVPATEPGDTMPERDPSPEEEPPEIDFIEAVPGLPADTLAHWTGMAVREAEHAAPEAVRAALPLERRVLHDGIEQALLDVAPSVPIGEQPVAVLMMGGPASGKSAVTKHLDLKRFVQIDADAIKDKLPEYREAISKFARNAAPMAHEESSYLAKRVRTRAIEARQNFLFDGTGANAEAYSDLVWDLKRRGYKVQVFAVDTDVDVAVKRAIKRAKEKGRMPPEPYIRATYPKVRKSFARVAEYADEARLYDTTAAGRGPAPIFAKREGYDIVYDEAGHVRFLAGKAPSVPRVPGAAEPVMAPALSKASDRWLEDWTFTTLRGAKKLPTQKMLQEFAIYRPTAPVRLYRYCRAGEAAEAKMNLRSFTHSREVVEFMLETNEGQGEIIETLVDPKNIVVDFTQLPRAADFLDEVIVSRYDLTLLQSGPLL